MKQIDCEIETVVRSPGPGIGVHAAVYPCSGKGTDLISIHTHHSRSDTIDVAFVRRSTDNGRSWTEPDMWPTRFNAETGTGRRHPRGGYVDPGTGRYISFWTQGILPNDNPVEGMRHWVLFYSVSEDGGRTTEVEQQIVQDEPGFDEMHPLPGVTVGRNSVMMGDLTCRPLTLFDGSILLPAQSPPVGPDGEYWNPCESLSYTDALLIRGRWRPDRRLAWRAAGRVKGDPARSTRGMIEPTLAVLSGQRLLMVMRGSNAGRPELPGYKWFSISEDCGDTWSAPAPWTFTGGDRFFSPSSCSQLLRHSSGALYWAGNICDRNPNGNSPRYPLVLGEVDQDSGLVIRDSLRLIDDRRAGESERLTLSNFYVREDYESRALFLYISRSFAVESASGKLDWASDALLYRMCPDI